MVEFEQKAEQEMQSFLFFLLLVAPSHSSPFSEPTKPPGRPDAAAGARANQQESRKLQDSLFVSMPWRRKIAFPRQRAEGQL